MPLIGIPFQVVDHANHGAPSVRCGHLDPPEADLTLPVWQTNQAVSTPCQFGKHLYCEPVAEIDLLGVGRRLEAVRRTIGLSKGDFARAFGLSPSVYARIIKGERLLLANHAFDLYKTYNISMDFIYLGDKRALAPDMRAGVEKQLTGTS